MATYDGRYRGPLTIPLCASFSISLVWLDDIEILEIGRRPWQLSRRRGKVSVCLRIKLIMSPNLWFLSKGEKGQA